MTEVESILTKRGVFRGAHGLEGLAEAHEFWNDQPYGTRLYYGPGGLDYLHHSVLKAAILALRSQAEEIRQFKEHLAL